MDNAKADMILAQALRMIIMSHKKVNVMEAIEWISKQEVKRLREERVEGVLMEVWLRVKHAAGNLARELRKQEHERKISDGTTR